MCQGYRVSLQHHLPVIWQGPDRVVDESTLGPSLERVGVVPPPITDLAVGLMLAMQHRWVEVSHERGSLRGIQELRPF